jgi:prepilin-type N-terminal cleavage/methylation domain-containing protein
MRLEFKRTTRGFTLIEVGITSVLLGMLASGVLLFTADQLRTSTAEASGTALLSLNDAVNSYEATYAANLTAHTAVPIPGYANVANPYSPTPTELLELGFLKSSLPSGVYGISIGSSPVNGEPSGVTWVIKPFTDTLGQPSQSLAGAAMISAGGDAAMSTVANPSVVAGADGWSTTNPQTNTAAILAMRNGAGSGAFLKLNGSTPMQGSLNMGTYSISNASNVSATGTVSGANVTATGNVTASGNVTGGFVSSSGSVYAAQNVSAAGNTAGATLTATAEGNDVFFGSSALYSDGWNTVIRNVGGALYVQNFGGTAEPVVASQYIAPAGNGVQIGSSYYYGDSANSAIRQNGTLYIQNQAGTGAANIDAAQVTAESYLAVDGYAAAGAGCGQNGLIGQDGSGRLLSCVNGVWTAAGGSSGTNNYVSEDFTNGGVFWIPANTKRVDGYIQVSWTGSNAGVAEFVVHDTNGNIQNTFMAGDYGWNDGGSGSEWWIPVSIPVVSNSANIQMVQVNGSNTLNWHVASYEN